MPHTADHTGRRRTWLAAGALAMLVLTGAGCAKPGTAASREAPAPALLRTADLSLPLDAYQASTAEVSVLASGYRALLHRCMARYGFDFPPPAGPGAAGPRTRNERRYGLTDPAAAASRGYRYGNGDRPTEPARPARVALAPAEQAALTGQGGTKTAGKPGPTGGCADVASRALSARSPAGANTDLPQVLSAQSLTQSRQDPRVQAVTRQWAACMKARGYRYATPFEPAGDPRFRGPLTAAETATAKADVACKQQTNLVGVWFAVESALQRTLIDRDATALDLAVQATKAQLAAARAALHS